uniref:Uncharacterized protein n=1 Tax=uncultured prokaryote TaxID=198431 RepID=A0A0H5QKL0_9ZZZZ|nr:hypothetical protein [uncultured prokaryote]
MITIMPEYQDRKPVLHYDDHAAAVEKIMQLLRDGIAFTAVPQGQKEEGQV